MEKKTMQLLPDNLKESYEQDLKKCKEIPGLIYPLINVKDVLQAHYILADYFTDASAEGNESENILAGVRSEDLLASALGRQIVQYGNSRKYSDSIDICSTLFFGLVKDHAFHDGNKRTSLLTLLSQLKNYGYYPTNISEFEKLVMAVAEGSLSEKYAHVWKKFKKQDDTTIKCISYIVRKNTKRKDTSYHMNINMRVFCDSLSEHGVKWELDNMKIKFSRVVKKRGIFNKTLTYTIKFYGWTRAVEAKMARDTFNALEISDEFAKLSDIIDGGASLYKIISNYEVPFRRLKDK